MAEINIYTKKCMAIRTLSDIASGWLLEIYECVTISNDVNRVSVETVGRIKEPFFACIHIESVTVTETYSRHIGSDLL